MFQVHPEIDLVNDIKQQGDLDIFLVAMFFQLYKASFLYISIFNNITYSSCKRELYIFKQCRGWFDVNETYHFESVG